ncbi:MAG: GNAT family N-acetyltransferase [Flavobacteriales bacterium]|nr:GNAT family N-acetyltransferase [Flavobacteriales bacterium]MCB9204587.1 GNAT family N-acetyltransferase [Flavobacteriales bacterium]
MSTALRFSRIEPEQQAQLLEEIRNILTEVGAHNVEIYNQTYWDWQYKQLPTGKSYVYAAWDNDKIIGYYHVPVYRCVINGEEKLIGNIQDVAVNPNYRGVGLFRKLAEFANEDLDKTDVNLIYTFPNDKSIRTFLKYNNFSIVSAVPTYIRPVNASGIIRSKINLFGWEKLFGFFADGFINLFSKNVKLPNPKIERISEITEEVEAAFAEYSKGFRNHLLRDKAWLDWRYLKSIRGKHHILGVREEGQLTAVIVLKEDEMLGNPSLLIMDFTFRNGKENSLSFLIDQIRKNPELIGSEFNLIFISAIAPILPDLKQIGFYRIPASSNPRVLNLLARTSSSLDEKPLLQEQNWLLTLGDWDVF